MKIKNLSQIKQQKISNEEILFEFREGVKEAIVDLFLFEPDYMDKIFKRNLEAALK